jgi:IS5 family transposase
MKSLTDFALNEEYKRVRRLGDKRAEIKSLIDWEAFRPIVGEMYDNKSARGGRPNIDEVVKVRLLVLPQWHGLSDPELEKQVADRLSFRKFIGFSEDIPEYAIVNN